MGKKFLCLLLAGLLLCGCGAQVGAETTDSAAALTPTQTAAAETRLPAHAIDPPVPETEALEIDPEWTWETGYRDPYTVPPTVPDEIDFSTLEGCQSYTTLLNWMYGVDVRIGQDVMAVTPWDYDLEPETDVPTIAENLGNLEQWLSNYPKDMLASVAEAAGGLHISLVRGIYGKKGLGGIPTAAGLQYEEEGVPYIALTGSEYAEYTLYHELCHILENYIIPRSTAYDHWEDLNPPGFAYDNDYVMNQYREGEEYLEPETRAFIDTYSMSFPTEDRARIMEYAMTAGHGFLFESPIMQKKLRTLSLGIRQAFDLQEPEGAYLWEQYLFPETP